MSGKKLTYEINTSGRVDSSLISGFKQIQDAMKRMSEVASQSSSGMSKLSTQLSSQNSVLSQVSSAFQRAAAEGMQGTATFNDLAAAYISVSAEAEQTRNAIETGNDALKTLDTVSAEAKSQIVELTTSISEQKEHISELENQYQVVAEAMGEDSQEAQELKSQLDSMNSELEKSQSELRQVTESAIQAAQAEREYKSATQQIQEAISQKSSKLSELKAKYTEAVLSQGKFSKEARTTAKEIKTLSSSLAEDQNKLSSATQAADRFDQSLNSIGGSSGSAVSGINAIDVALGNIMSKMASAAWDKIKDFGKGIFETGMSYEKQMSKVASVAGISKTSQEFQDLSNAAAQYGKDTIYSATEAGQALEYMALAGWDTQQSIDALPSMLKLAAASGMELGATSDMVTDFMSAFSGSEMTIEQFANKLAVAQTSANTSVTLLQSAYQNSAATMNAYGQSVETTTAALMVMADQGVKGSQAGTYLNNIMSDMTNHADKLGKLGVSLTDSEGNFLQLTDIVDQLKGSLDGLSEFDKSNVLGEIFGKQSLKGINNLLGAPEEGEKTLKAYAEKLQNDALDAYTAENGGVSALQEMYDTATDNLQDRLTAFGSAVSDIQRQIYEGLEPMLTPIVDWATDIALSISEALSNFDFSALGGIIPIVAGIGAAAVGVIAAIKGWNIIKSIGSLFSRTTSQAQSSTSKIGSFFEGLGEGIATVFEGIGNSIQSIFEGIGSLNLTGAASFAVVVGALSLAFAGLAMVGEPVINLLQGISDAIASLVSGVLMGFANALVRVADVIPIVCSGLSQLSPLVVAIGEAIGATAPFIESLGTAISNIVVAVGEALAQILNAILPYVEPIGNIFTTLVQIVANCITGIIQALAPYASEIAVIVQATSEAVQAICQCFSTLLEQIAPVIDSISGLVSSLGSAINEALSGVAEVFRGVGEGIRSALDGIADIISAVGDAMIDAGVAFILLATGAKKLSECDLITLGGALLELAAGMSAIGAAGWVFNDAGDKMLTFAVGVEKLAENSSKMTTIVSRSKQMVEGLAELGPALSDAAASIQESGSQIDTAISNINTSLMEFTSSGQLATQVAMIITEGFMMIGQAALSGASQVNSGIQMAVSGFNNLSSVATSSMNRVSQVITTNLNKAQNTITTFISRAVSTFRSGMSSIQSSVSSTFASLAGYVRSGMNSMVASAQDGIARLRAVMNTTIESPRVKLPHISVSGKFDIEKGTAPSFTVEYYKKGAIMNGPTLFGFNGDKAMVGGEAGPEGIIPIDPLWNRLDAIEDGMNRLANISLSLLSESNNVLFRLMGMDEPEFNSTLANAGHSGSALASPSGDIIFSPNINISLSPTASANPDSIAQTVNDTLQNLFEQFKQELRDEQQEMRERSYAW